METTKWSLGKAFVCPIRSPHSLAILSGSLHPLLRGGDRQVIESPDKREVFETRKVFVDRRVLPGQPDTSPHRLSRRRHIMARYPGPTPVGDQDRGEHSNNGRLPRTVGPEQPEHRTAGYGKRHALHGMNIAERLA